VKGKLQLFVLTPHAADETMPAIEVLPHLRMLMCQNPSAGDAGFTALCRSQTLE
jgi:hypothetical protein